MLFTALANGHYGTIFFIALQHAQTTYEEKVKSTAKVNEKVLYKLAWMVHELEDLIKKIRGIVADMSSLIQSIQDPKFDFQKQNVARKLTDIRNLLLNAMKKLSKYQRKAATHIFVFIISSETRQNKPYALPVQCLPISSLKDVQACELCNHIVAAMLERGMKVAGMILTHSGYIVVINIVLIHVRVHNQWRI